MYEVRKTIEFEDWFMTLRDMRARAKILVRIKRIELGNLGDTKSVGAGVLEARIPYGPGYRLYFTKRSNTIILLLIGGDKSTQGRDIAQAKRINNEYE
jgi:putative addiction module killer protein